MGRILDLVASGEEVVITRPDKPVARLVPEGPTSLESVREAVAGLRALRQSQVARGMQPLTDEEIREAINTGRK